MPATIAPWTYQVKPVATTTAAKQQQNQSLELLKGLPFYYWDKPKDQQHGTFVGIVGLPVKNDVTHGLYDYERDIINYLETNDPANPKNRHLYILKSAGLGITTLLLYYIGWKCTTSNDWNNSRVCILTAPRLELTIDIVDRLKGIFRRNDILDFDSRKTICNINNVKIEAFPSSEGHALKGMRGLTDVKMIVCDEASFFDDSTINEVRDTIERYWSKTNPIIVLCSTPNRPDDLMHKIQKEPEDKCIYHRKYLDWRYGENQIYTQQELAFQRLSPSWGREYNLEFAGVIGNVFSIKDIDRAVEKGKKIDLDIIYDDVPTSLGIDPGYGSSSFGIVITQWIDQQIVVTYAEEFVKADFDEMIDITQSLIYKYNITAENSSSIYIDAANPSFIRRLKQLVGDNTQYEKQIDRLKATWKKSYSLKMLKNSMLITPIPFSTEHKALLSHCKEALEFNEGTLAIHPKFDKLITSLRTAVANEYSLDKEATSYDDILDALRLSLQYYH